MVYYNCSKGERFKRPQEKISKKFEKTLDNNAEMWYNKTIKRGTSAAKAPRTVENRNRSGLVTNIHEIYLFRRSRSGAVRLMAETQKKQVSEVASSGDNEKSPEFFQKTS